MAAPMYLAAVFTKIAGVPHDRERARSALALSKSKRHGAIRASCSNRNRAAPTSSLARSLIRLADAQRQHGQPARRIQFYSEAISLPLPLAAGWRVADAVLMPQFQGNAVQCVFQLRC